MKINFLILMLIISLTALWTFRSNTRAPNAIQIDRERIPNFTYKDHTGKTNKLHNHEGKIIFLHFWATWCAPCLAELPELIKLTKRNQNNLIVLAISKDKNKEDMIGFINQLDIPLPENIKFIFDDNYRISEGIFNIEKLPETIIVNTDLAVQEKIIGAEDNWNTQKWMRKIAQ